MMTIVQKSIFIVCAFMTIALPGSARADMLTDLGTSLGNTLTQSTQNAQSGAQNGVNSAIQSSVPPHQNVVMPNLTTAQMLNPRTLCSQVPAELRSKYVSMCASFDPGNPCSSLPIDGSFAKIQSKLATMCNVKNGNTAALQNQYAPQTSPSAISQTITQQLQNQINNVNARR